MWYRRFFGNSVDRTSISFYMKAELTERIEEAMRFPRSRFVSTWGRRGKQLDTAAPVSIDPYVVAFGHETIFEGSQIEGALSRRLRQTQGAGRKDLLGFDALHKALAKKTSRDRGCRARADSRQAL